VLDDSTVKTQTYSVDEEALVAQPEIKMLHLSVYQDSGLGFERHHTVQRFHRIVASAVAYYTYRDSALMALVYCVVQAAVTSDYCNITEWAPALYVSAQPAVPALPLGNKNRSVNTFRMQQIEQLVEL
jgi:hypothetical protein